MARILMTWELGSGLGHLSTLLALATPLKAANHDVVFTVCDPGHAAPTLGQAGMRFYQCPINPNTLPPKIQFYSLPQILLGLGYANVSALQGRIDAWRALYDLLKPDLMVSDASPTALLASKGLGFKTLAVGTGFFMPPFMTPLPTLRPWLKLDHKELARQEALLLTNINTVLKKYPDVSPLQHAAEAFSADRRIPMTLRELDFYAASRDTDESYWGPVPAAHGAKPEWPKVTGKRIFVYLRRFDTLPSLLETLKASGQAVLLYISDLPADLREKFASENMHFVDRPLNIAQVLNECHLAILHGGHGATGAALLAGKPMLLLPVHLEMMLNSQAAAKVGAALVAPQLKPAGMEQKFQLLLTDPKFATAAQKFASRYAELDLPGIPERLVLAAEQLLAS